MREAKTVERTSRPRRAREGPPAPRITVLVADDHQVVRQGLRALLDAEPDLQIVGEAADGRVTVEMAERLHPDVVLMDVAMPDLNGLEATRQIVRGSPATRVLMLSAHRDAEYVRRAAEIGAAGYILKESSLAELATAIRVAHSGGSNFGAAGAPAAARGPGAPRPLTSREAEVLQLIAEGKANKQSAAALGISIKTVEKYRQSLMTKLDIHDVAGLTRYAIAHGTIEGRDRGVEI